MVTLSTKKIGNRTACGRGEIASRVVFCSSVLTANDVISIVVGEAKRTGRKATRSISTAATTATTTLRSATIGQARSVFPKRSRPYPATMTSSP